MVTETEAMAMMVMVMAIYEDEDVGDGDGDHGALAMVVLTAAAVVVLVTTVKGPGGVKCNARGLASEDLASLIEFCAHISACATRFIPAPRVYAP